MISRGEGGGVDDQEAFLLADTGAQWHFIAIIIC